ncbi:myosin-binding protein 1-like [Malania oleifera]|uniref:myosin-binding protein 1-like n=1 Tax=Malania oleifera TaxID=397392 RepID=UPI0025ADCA66|nr:myosin-binding protein 1-like [Malania oleifera]
MGIPSVKQQRNLKGFLKLLSSVACEWVLIFFLFVDAVLWHWLTKFARYCELQMPCLLCSRLDYVLGEKNHEFCSETLCSSHRLGISSLISCHIHGKLADAEAMCEECLLSFVTHDKSKSESHRLLMGKFGFDIGHCGFQKPLKNFGPSFQGTMPCSCCKKPWRSRPNIQRLVQPKPLGLGVTKPDIPLPRPVGHNRLDTKDGLKRIRDKISGSCVSNRLGNKGFDPLAHVGYSQLKITSDSESEFPFSDDDDDDGSTVVYKKDDPKEDFAAQCAQEILSRKLHVDLAPVRLANQFKSPPSLLLDLSVQSEVTEPSKILPSDVNIWHGLGQLDWQQADQKPNPSILSNLILLDDIPTFSSGMKVPVAESRDTYVTRFHKFGPGNENEDIESTNVTTDNSKLDQILNRTTQSTLDSGDTYQLAFGKRGKDAFQLVQQLAGKDSSGDNEELKPVTSLSFAAQGNNKPADGSNPRVHGFGNDVQISDASNSSGIQLLQSADSTEQSESLCEFPDDSNLDGFEGESTTEQLKQKIDHDRRCMNALYKELEEERSAAAIAANEAMAMITKLQEEKASLRMEALQYLRMMEEEAEYDVDALEKANDLLAEKEKDIQDLEAELEFYRSQFSAEFLVENLREETGTLEMETKVMENTSVQSIEKNNANVACNSATAKESEGHMESVIVKSSLPEFENEKLYISNSLKRLEKKLHQYLSDQTSTNMPASGNEGLQHIQEIAHQLQELQKIGTSLSASEPTSCVMTK